MHDQQHTQKCNKVNIHITFGILHITLHYLALHFTTLHYITLQYITFHYILLHSIALHYIVLYYNYITSVVQFDISKTFKRASISAPCYWKFNHYVSRRKIRREYNPDWWKITTEVLNIKDNRSGSRKTLVRCFWIIRYVGCTVVPTRMSSWYCIS